MTAIKEYPFDLSDLQNQPSVAGDTRPTQTQPAVTQPTAVQPTAAPPNPPTIKPRVSVPSLEGKRKVSIMADESSKDRENLPSDRYVTHNIYFFIFPVPTTYIILKD